MDKPWEGFWQVLPITVDEDIVAFGSTTTTIRADHGVVIYTREHFMELRFESKVMPPEGWPPTETELVKMFRAFRATTGRCAWTETDQGWLAEHHIEMASDPRLEGKTSNRLFEFDGDCCRSAFDAERDEGEENLRRLSGPGRSPLAGAWRSGGADGQWVYLVTAGHYGVMHASAGRQASASNRDEFSDAEIVALARGFGANAGARIETPGTFEHWPMIASTSGFEVRKHETFRLEHVGRDEFAATLPLRDLSVGEWRRVGY